MIKEEFDEIDSILKKDIENLDSYLLKDELNLEGKILIGENKRKEPDWLEFLRGFTEEQIDTVFNASNRAVILARIDANYFAVVFGYGRYLLKDESIVKDFGLKVAINAVDADNLRSVDVANVEEMMVQTRKQLSRSSPQEVFGLDATQDLMRAVTGVPRDGNFASNLTGKEGLKISAKMDFYDLPDKLTEIYTYYKRNDYKNNFEWIDNISEEKDKFIIGKLNNSLIENLQKNNLEKMHLAPPELVDWAEIDSIQYMKSKKKYNDLQIKDYLEHCNNIDDLNLKKLKRDNVIVNYAGGEQVPRWKIYNLIVFETELDGENYILAMGQWYKINTNFAQEVKDYVKNIEEANLNFPSCEFNMNEADYNNMVIEQKSGLVNLDAVNIWCEGARTQIEPCDIFSEDKQLIHVKHKRSSSTLSHLFSQGRVSAESFLEDSKFRQELKGYIEARSSGPQGSALSEMIPEEDVNSADFEVVYAIIDKSSYDLEDSLPFFSLLNLKQSTRYLKLLGFKVKKYMIRQVY